MKFRAARHTNNLAPIIEFYHSILGLEILGDFKAHDNYDGVFLGLPEAGWHLEFTTSHEPAQHHPDADDLLVFYPESQLEFDALIQQFASHNIPATEPKNAYWKVNGISYTDPDGFGIIIVRPIV